MRCVLGLSIAGLLAVGCGPLTEAAGTDAGRAPDADSPAAPDAAVPDAGAPDLPDAGGQSPDAEGLPPPTDAGNPDTGPHAEVCADCSAAGCASGTVCAASGGEDLCLPSCAVGCPPGFSCSSSGGQALCAPSGACCIDWDRDGYGVGRCRGPDCDDHSAQTSPEASELCDGEDNDCDGVTDEGNPGGGAPCDSGQTGACAAGTTACVDGALVCEQTGQPAPEICDGQDNDCDGATDDGEPGGGAACHTGMLGICAAGTTACAEGALVCRQSLQPVPEVCDGLDNDCDGQIDEGNPGGGMACNSGKPGVCSAGNTSCAEGALVCSQGLQPTPEVCDGQDNDCDGQVDEGNPGGGVACNTGKPGVCSAGATACVGGNIACSQIFQPSAEVCADGQDNDCNGRMDCADGVCVGQICGPGKACRAGGACF